MNQPVGCGLGWGGRPCPPNALSFTVAAALDDDGGVHIVHAAQDGVRYVHGTTDELVLDTFPTVGVSMGLDDGR